MAPHVDPRDDEDALADQAQERQDLLVAILAGDDADTDLEPRPTGLSANHVQKQLVALGELMYQSHASYSAIGLGSNATDTIVQLVRSLGPDSGLHGAKITGGGSGGTVAVLGHVGAGEAIERVVERYRKDMGHSPYVFSGSSPGALAFGHIRLRPA